MTDFFSFLLDEYVSKIYWLVDFLGFTSKNKDLREFYFYIFVVSSVVTVIVSATASIEFFSNIRKNLNNIFDHFFKLISNLFKLVLLLISAPLQIILGFFMSAAFIGIFVIIISIPWTPIVVNFKKITTIDNFIYVILYTLILQASLYLIAEFGRFIEKINYYLNGDEDSEKIKPASFFSICKNYSTELFSDTNIRNLALRLVIFFAMYVVAVTSLFPLAFFTIWNVIILPYAFIRFIFRRLVHS
jgi:hypothetical protein